MPTVIGQTSDGRDIIKLTPSEGCLWRCTPCGNYLRGRSEVWGHWMLFFEGHSIFEKLSTGEGYHQTIEGLHRREWDISKPPGQPDEIGQHSSGDIDGTPAMGIPDR